jgi:hypothetical protein
VRYTRLSESAFRIRKQGIRASASLNLYFSRRRFSGSALLAAATLLCGLAIVPRVSAGTEGLSGKPKDAVHTASDANSAGSSSLYIEVLLSRRLKISGLKPGDVIEGRLSRNVYSGDRQVFPSGAPVRLKVNKLERRRRESNEHWPGIVGLFTPRHENYPRFQSAAVSLASGLEMPLRVNLVSIGRRVEIRAPAKQSGHTQAAIAPGTNPEEKQPLNSGSDASAFEPLSTETNAPVRGQTVVLEADGLTPEQAQTLSLAPSVQRGLTPPVVAAGTRGQIVLLNSLSASKNHPGDLFRARLIEPVRVGSTVVLPEGSVLEGKVVKTSPPRWLSRPGSLQMTFTGLTPPGGVTVPLPAAPAGVEVDQRSASTMNSEGSISGGKPGKARMLINLGVTAGIAKAADDTTQLVLEALVSTATDASTAGVAQIVAACASAALMVTRHGRDVALPRFTRMEIAFERAVSASRSPQ